MDKKEFEKRLGALPQEEPDEIDNMMMKAAEESRGGDMNLEAQKSS